MRLKNNLSIRKIGDEYIMVSDSGSTLDYTRVISLNDSAAYLVQSIGETAFTKDILVNLLIEKYDISKHTAEEDVQNLIDKLREEGLIDE